MDEWLLTTSVSCKELESCITNTFSCTGFVVHYDYKLLQHLQVPIFSLWWVLAGFLEYNGGLWKHILCLSCRLFPSTRKADTTSQQLIANYTLSIGHNDSVWSLYLSHLISQEMETFCFICVISQEALPVLR